jgi:hypothetical protein
MFVECKEIGKHLGRFCPGKRPDLANMANEELCARCPLKGHFSVDCPNPQRDQPDEAKLQELDERFNKGVIHINVYSSDPEAEEESASLEGDTSFTTDPVNLAYYRDEEGEKCDTDPGNE